MDSEFQPRHDDFDLVGQLYEAALAPERWPEVLDRLARRCGGGGAVVTLVDPRYAEISLVFHASSVYTPRIQQEYFEHYAAHDRAGAVFTAPAGRIVIDEELWPDPAEFARDPLIQWRRARTGLPRSIGINLNNGEGFSDCLLVQCADHAWPPPAAARAALRAFHPHVARAVQLGRLRAIVEARYRRFLEALDHLRIGVAVLEGNGAVVASNEVLRRVVEERGALRLHAERLVASVAEDDRALQACLRAALPVRSAGGGTPVPSAGHCRVRSRDGGSPCLLDIVPLGQPDLAGGALLFAIDPDDTASFSADGIDTLYALTPTEKAVCDLVGQGLSNREIADARGVSPETIKTHVANVLAKTGRANRFELLRLLVKVNPPLR